MKLRNVSKHDIEETVFGYGVVRLGAGKTADIPDEVATLWLSPARQEVCVEAVTAEPKKAAPGGRGGNAE